MGSLIPAIRILTFMVKYYNTLIDRKAFPLSATYNSPLGQTTITFPYPITGTPVVVTYSNVPSSDVTGESLTILSQTSTTVVVAGDYSSKPLLVGQRYKQRVRLSEPVIRQQNAQGQASVGFERIQVKALKIQTNNTGYYQVEVTPRYRDTYIKSYGASLQTSDMVLGLPNLSNDMMTVHIMSKSDQVTVDLTNDSHMPSSFTALEWTFEVVYKTRKI